MTAVPGTPTFALRAQRYLANALVIAVAVLTFLVLVGSLIGCKRSVNVAAKLDEVARLNDLGRFDQALSMLAEDPLKNNPRTYYLQGIALESTGKLEKAIQAYSKCLELDPNFAEALNNRAVVHGTLNQLDLAIQDLKKAVEISPSDPFAWTNLGLAVHESGKFQDAIQHYNQAAGLESSDPEVFFQRGNSYLALKDHPLAIADFNRAIALDPQFSQALLNKAIALYRIGETDSARQTLAEAERHDDDMSVAALAQNFRNLLDGAMRPELGQAKSRIKNWLRTNGWEVVEDVGLERYDFFAKRLPVAGADAAQDYLEIDKTPDEFWGLVLIGDQDGTVICDARTLQAIWDSEESRTTCLIVVSEQSAAVSKKGAGNSNTAVRSIDQLPGVIHVDYDWQPSKETASPESYRLAL